MADDILQKAERVLKQMALVAEKSGGTKVRIDVASDAFAEAVGMTFRDVLAVMPVLEDKRFVARLSTTRYSLMAAGLEAAKGLHAKPRPGPRVVSLDLTYVTDAPLREVLERNAKELQKTLDAEAWTAAIVLSGAIAEGVLYFIHSQKQAAAEKAAQVLATRTKRRLQPFAEWNLWTYIEVADELGYFGGATKKLVHDVLRDFRNMIHPRVQIDQKLTPSETAADGSLVYLRAVVVDVAEALKKP